MMSAFFHYQHTVNRLFDNYIKLYWYLDKFFIEYEELFLQINHPPPLKKLPSKTALRRIWENYFISNTLSYGQKKVPGTSMFWWNVSI